MAIHHAASAAQGQVLYLSGGATHALRGIEDSSVLVTILLR